MDANLPIRCFPVPYPPPEPEPDSLDESVDWMTYPHEELYRMVHEGLDLGGATSVSADWARLGDALGEIGDELQRMGKAFADAWQGEAADQARHAITALATWAQETGPRATEVSTLITLEMDNAMRARDAMPKPMVPEPGPGPVPREPAPVPDSPHATVANAFSDPGLGSANLLVNDQDGIAGPSHAAHQQAADTMERFQTDSRDVYNTVPQFSAPKVGPKPPGRDNPPPPEPAPTPPQQTPESPPAGPGRSPAGSVPVSGGGGPSGGPGMPVSAPVASPAPRPEPGAGAGAGTGPVPGSTSAPAAAASANRPGGGGTAMGGVPMGGMGATNKPEDQERKSPAYLKEDEDLWGLGDNIVSPPVLGEDERRA